MPVARMKTLPTNKRDHNPVNQANISLLDNGTQPVNQMKTPAKALLPFNSRRCSMFLALLMLHARHERQTRPLRSRFPVFLELLIINNKYQVLIN